MIITGILTGSSEMGLSPPQSHSGIRSDIEYIYKFASSASPSDLDDGTKFFISHRVKDRAEALDLVTTKKSLLHSIVRQKASGESVALLRLLNQSGTELFAEILVLYGVTGGSFIPHNRYFQFSRIEVGAGAISIVPSMTSASLSYLEAIRQMSKGVSRPSTGTGSKDPRGTNLLLFMNEISAFLHELIGTSATYSFVNMYDVLGLIRGESGFVPYAVAPGTSASGLFQFKPSTLLDSNLGRQVANQYKHLGAAPLNLQLKLGIYNIVRMARSGGSLRSSGSRFKLRCFNWFPSFGMKRNIDEYLPVTTRLNRQTYGSDRIGIGECYYGILDGAEPIFPGYRDAARIYSGQSVSNSGSVIYNEAPLGIGFTRFISEAIHKSGFNEFLRQSERQCATMKYVIEGSTPYRRIAVGDGFGIVTMHDNEFVREYSSSFNECFSDVTQDATATDAFRRGCVSDLAFALESAGNTGDTKTGRSSDPVPVLNPRWFLSRSSKGINDQENLYLQYLSGDLRTFSAVNGVIPAKVVDAVFGDKREEWPIHSPASRGRGSQSTIDRASVRLMNFLDFGVQGKPAEETVFYNASLMASLVSRVTGADVAMLNAAQLANPTDNAALSLRGSLTLPYRM